jgi:hypothetical protein
VSDEIQKPDADEAMIEIRLKGPAAKSIRRVALAMNVDAESAAYAMAGIGLGVFMQRMANGTGIEELVAVAEGRIFRKPTAS